MTLFEFRIYFKNFDGTIDYDFLQKRYVLANDEWEAERKLNAYREEMIKNGFADFVYNSPLVEVQSVIC